MSLVVGITKKCRVHFVFGRIVTRDSTTFSGMITTQTTRYIDIGVEDSGASIIYFVELLWLKVYVETYDKDRIQKNNRVTNHTKENKTVPHSSNKIVAFNRPRQPLPKGN